MQGTLLILDPIAATPNLFLIQDTQDRKSNDFRFNEDHNTKTTTLKKTLINWISLKLISALLKTLSKR